MLSELTGPEDVKEDNTRTIFILVRATTGTAAPLQTDLEGKEENKQWRGREDVRSIPDFRTKGPVKLPPLKHQRLGTVRY